MFYERLGGWLVAHRVAVLAVILAVTIGAALMIPRLEFDFRLEAMLDFSEEENEFAAALQQRFQTQDNALIVIIHGEPGALYTTEGLTLLYELTEKLETYEGVTGTFSLTRVPSRSLGGGLSALFLNNTPPPLVEALPVNPEILGEVRAQVEHSRIIEGNLVSHDASTALVIVALDPEYHDPNRLDPVVQKMEAELPELVEKSGASFELHFGGLPWVRLATIRELKSEQLVMWPILGFAYFLLVLLVYRRVLESAMPLIAVGLATLWTVGLAATLGMAANMINNALPTLILVIGVTNSVHVMGRIIEEKRQGATPRQAIVRAIAGVGLASLLTTLTTAIGFLSLVVAHSTLLREFGILMGAGVMLTYLAIIVVLPVFASFLKLDIDNPANARRSARLGDWLGRNIGALMRRPWGVLGAAMAVLAVAGALGARVPVDSRVIEVFHRGHPVVETNLLIEEQLGGILPLEVDIRATPGTFARAEPLQRVARFANEVREIDGVLNVMSLVDLLQETGMSDEQGPPSDAAVQSGLSILRKFQPDALHSFSTEALDNVRVSVRLPDDGIVANLTVIHSIEAYAEQLLERPVEGSTAPPVAEDITWRITGQAYLSAVGLDTFVRDLFLSLVTATAIIFVVLVAVFRSLRVGMLSLLPNLIPLAITLAAMPLFGYDLNTTTVVVFCIGIGLSVDNAIHITERFRQEARAGRTLDEAILTSLRTAGIAIITSNLLLIGGFSILLISDFDPLQRVARLTITTVGAGLFASLIVLPAELKLFGQPLLERWSGRRVSGEPPAAPPAEAAAS